MQPQIQSQSTVFIPPLPSTASRLPAPRSNVSNRAVIYDPVENRLKVAESALERKVFLVLRARPDILLIEDQPPAVQYLDALGDERTHHFDFRVTLQTGKKIAVAVKPFAIAQRRNLKSTLALIAARLPQGYSDRVTLITDRDLHGDVLYNAELIHSCRRNPNPNIEQQIREILSNTHGAVRIEDLVKQTGHAGMAFRAVVHLIALGELELSESTRIIHSARIRVANTLGGAR
ncbi:hypothetical protein [Brucella tritici]|uniref:hypothetical protein n=1 Tax=Brucella tritici TaxID=94626 RepID=UPI003D6D82C9